jgi:L-iditol 2-dehydrogenase
VLGRVFLHRREVPKHGVVMLKITNPRGHATLFAPTRASCVRTQNHGKGICRTAKMKALLLFRYRQMELVDLPVPAPAAGEVLVRVAACGICGSDVHGYDGSSGRRIPPIVMGHEAAGVVAQTGDGVTKIKKGDRVTFDSTVFCGACDFCLQGQVNLCDRREVLGVSCAEYRRYGAFAEYVAVPAHIVYPLPDKVSFVEAAMLEAVAVALHAISLTEITRGATVVVVGAGMIGLLIVQALRVAGCSRIVVIDIDESRLKLAEHVGATAMVSASDPDVLNAIRRLTEHKGAEAVIEAVGKNETVNLAIDLVRKGGCVTLVGNVSPNVSLPLQKVVTRQIRLQGSCASAGEYTRAIELLASGAIQVKNLISAVSRLDEGPSWFERLYAREPNLMKVVLTPENPV